MSVGAQSCHVTYKAELFCIHAFSLGQGIDPDVNCVGSRNGRGFRLLIVGRVSKLNKILVW